MRTTSIIATFIQCDPQLFQEMRLSSGVVDHFAGKYEPSYQGTNYEIDCGTTGFPADQSPTLSSHGVDPFWPVAVCLASGCRRATQKRQCRATRISADGCLTCWPQRSCHDARDMPQLQAIALSRSTTSTRASSSLQLQTIDMRPTVHALVTSPPLSSHQDLEGDLDDLETLHDETGLGIGKGGRQSGLRFDYHTVTLQVTCFTEFA